MKAVLLLCLLAFITCEKNIADIGKCIYKAPKAQELINDVIVAIATKDYSKFLPKIKEALPELIKIVIGCITDEKAIEDENKVEIFLGGIFSFCNSECHGKGITCYKKCAETKKIMILPPIPQLNMTFI